MADEFKELKDYKGEELAELLSGEYQRLMQAYNTITNSILVLHQVQHELERRKLNANDKSPSTAC